MNKPPNNEPQQVVVFRLEDEAFGIDIFRVREIVRVLEITPVPNTRPHVKGLVNLRGNTIPVMDLALRFGREASVATHASRIVILESDFGQVGVLVDEVCEVLHLQEGMVEVAPDLVTRNCGEFLTHVANRSDQLISLLDVDKVLAA